MNKKIIAAVAKQIGGMRELKNRAADIADYGAAGGFGGFTYYSDTITFTDKNLSLILEAAEELAQDIGEGDAYELIAGFNCLQDLNMTAGTVARALYQKGDEDGASVKNALAWFALEEAARSIVDEREL